MSKLLMFVLTVILCVQPWTHPANAQDTIGAGAGTKAALLTELQKKTIQELVAKGEKLGYKVVFLSMDFGTIDVQYSKIGKTNETHGLLGKHWDQRETINVQYLPTTEGVKVTSAKRVVEQKAPIGQWTMTSENSSVPMEFLAAAPVN
jgi:hypothetical protein